MSGWRPDLAIEQSVVDEQHQELFRRAAEVDTALCGDLTGDPTLLLKYLADYCKMHFSTEQRLMYNAKYPGVRDHLAQHAWFARTLRGIEGALASGADARGVAMQLNELILGWLVNHIASTDKAMGSFLRGQQTALGGARTDGTR